MSDIAIKVENLRKRYRLGAIGGGTLSADLESWWARKRGKEDPNTLIGTDQTRIGESFYALDDINFEIKKGEAVGVIGSNGAGKSTLLKILSRVTMPTEGRVGINGRITSMLEVGTGFHPELTGRENIYMNGAILGMTKAEIDAKIEDIIDFSECRQFIDTPVKRYSSGMYVKLGFAVAAHLDSEIMIMDEVLAVGDVKFQRKCLGKMGNASQNEGKTVLYVSHNMDTIRQLCSRCIVLDQGRIIYDGNVTDAIQIYMGSNRGDLVKVYNFENIERSRSDLGSKIFIEKLEFMNVRVPVYKERGRMQIKVNLKGKTDISGLRFYCPVKALDDSPVALIETPEICDIKKGEKRVVNFDVGLEALVPGQYYFKFTVFSMSSLAGHESYDQPITKILFEIESNGNVNRLKFEERYWGNFRLDDIRVKEVITLNE